MFYVCSLAVALNEEAECTIEVVPAAAACNFEARRLAGLAKAGRQEPVVRLLDRGVSGRRGAGGPDGKAGSPGNGAATA